MAANPFMVESQLMQARRAQGTGFGGQGFGFNGSNFGQGQQFGNGYNQGQQGVNRPFFGPPPIKVREEAVIDLRYAGSVSLPRVSEDPCPQLVTMSFNGVANVGHKLGQGRLHPVMVRSACTMDKSVSRAATIAQYIDLDADDDAWADLVASIEKAAKKANIKMVPIYDSNIVGNVGGPNVDQPVPRNLDADMMQAMQTQMMQMMMSAMPAPPPLPGSVDNSNVKTGLDSGFEAVRQEWLRRSVAASSSSGPARVVIGTPPPRTFGPDDGPGSGNPRDRKHARSDDRPASVPAEARPSGDVGMAK